MKYGLWLILGIFSLSANSSLASVSYLREIQPIFNQKCIACHACAQSPCQLNLASYEGIRRGAAKINLYEKRPTRLAPLRLFVDGNSESEWRTKGFWSVIGSDKSSILWEMLELKQDFPSEKITSSTEKALLDSSMCQSLEQDHRGDIDRFRKYFRRSFSLRRPVKQAYGMPYGLPGLTPAERNSVRRWLDEGAPGPTENETTEATLPKSEAIAAKIKSWENLLNGSSLKERLVSRYLYEHLFLAHIFFGDDREHFQSGAENEFYRLVRAKEKDGAVKTESRARHPYDEPALGGKFYYRFRKLSETIVHKSHITYQLNDRKQERIKELFFDSGWDARAFPPYGPEGANPFTTYADIPAWARYQFLLDDAEFFTRNDIRGPVCSGKFAVNVIQDLGWRLYLKPTSDVSVSDPGFFEHRVGGERIADLLSMPAETQTSTIEATLALLQRTFLTSQRSYIAGKDALILGRGKKKIGVNDIWDGDGNAHRGLKHGERGYPGALQTIVRNFDSADVTTGLHGNLPKTAELFDFPLMERTYYNLVTGFDVYGSTIDGLNTRAYKDALRIESEDNFLRLAPYGHRSSIRAYWYSAQTFLRRLALAELMDRWHPLLPEPSVERDSEDALSYASLGEEASGETVSDAVMRNVARHFRKMGLGRPDHINCVECGDNKVPLETNLEIVSRFQKMRKSGAAAQFFPEVAFLRIATDGSEDVDFTILANRFRTNTKFVVAEGATNVPERDKLMVVDGLLGSFPNVYFRIGKNKLGQFISQLEGIASEKDYAAFLAAWGVGRNDPGIFELNDWFYQQMSKRNPVEAARYDLSRYDIFY